MARSLPVYLAMCIFAFNIGIMLVNTIDNTWMTEMNMTRSLFGTKITQDMSYDTMTDAQGQTVNYSNKDSVKNATDRAASYGPQNNAADTFGFLTMTKNSILAVVNFLYTGFFGLPSLLYKIGMDAIFVAPMYIIVGFIEIFGIYEIIRGTSL